MDKTFSWSGITKEAKRVRWPKKKDVLTNTGEVLNLYSLTSLLTSYYVISLSLSY